MKGEEVNMTAENVRRLWELLLKIRDEEKGEHDTSYEVEVKQVEGRLVCATGKKGNSPLAI